MRSLAGAISLASIAGLSVVVLLLLLAASAVVERLSPPTFTATVANTPAVSADAWQVFDVETGAVLFTHASEEVRPVASITKLSTGAVLLLDEDLFATTTITYTDVATEGRAGRLVAGEVYRRHTLLFPLLLESSNDAAVALARTEPDLLETMNAYARNLGLVNTSFADSSGLSDQNSSTVSEIAVLLRHFYFNARHLIDISNLDSYLTSTTGWINNSPFRNDLDYRGGKHGFTPQAGQTAAVLFEESIRGGDRMIGYVLLGSSDLVADTKRLRQHVQQSIRVH